MPNWISLAAASYDGSHDQRLASQLWRALHVPNECHFTGVYDTQQLKMYNSIRTGRSNADGPETPLQWCCCPVWLFPPSPSIQAGKICREWELKEHAHVFPINTLTLDSAAAVGEFCWVTRTRVVVVYIRPAIFSGAERAWVLNVSFLPSFFFLTLVDIGRFFFPSLRFGDARPTQTLRAVSVTSNPTTWKWAYNLMF